MINDNGSAVLCTKEPSEHPVGEAGWLHVLDPKANLDYKPTEFEQLFVRYRQNVVAGMAEIIASDLSVTAASVEQLGVGFYPLENAWVWAEMDEHGNVIGLLKRYHNGKKVMVKGSSRGLIYQYPLPKTDKPILVVEGASDVLAAMDMGYVCVGRPSADGGGKLLSALLKGRDAIIVGENDGTVGISGMEKMFSILKPVCKTLRKVLPPADKKDLRAWHPNAAEFEQWVSQYADTADTNRVIEEVNMLELAQRWVEEVYTIRGTRLFHWLHGEWYKHNGTYYEPVEEKLLDRDLYEYFNQFDVIERSGKDVKCKRLNPNSHFVHDMQHALGAAVYVRVPKGVFEPFCINSGEHIDVTKTIVFQNGLLDVDTDELRPLTPDIFVTSTLPYNYDPKAQCKLWQGFVRDVFNGDQGCHDLLQEWFGYNMVASNHMQQMLFLFGVPGSGKSTTIDVLTTTLGEERVCPLNIEDMTSQFGLEQLVGKYAAIITEDKAANHTDADRVMQKLKKITGQDMISVGRKYKEAVHVRFFSRFTYAGNELPRFHDEPQAMMRRFLLLFFPNNYYERDGGPDRTLGLRLRVEAQGIANWALEGLKRLLANSKFTEPSPSQEHLQDFRELSSPLATMISEHCELGSSPECWASIDSLCDLQRAYYEEEGLTSMGSALFKSRIKTVIPKLERTRKIVAGEQVYVYKGIRIKRSAERKYLGKP
jgi:putative DNA primase/helicase